VIQIRNSATEASENHFEELTLDFLRRNSSAAEYPSAQN